MTINTYSFDLVYTGASANDGTGDDLRTAFTKVNDNFSNIAGVGLDVGNVVATGTIQTDNLEISGGNLITSNTYVPTLANSVGTTGQLTWDNDYIYVCIGTDTWKRANLVAW